MYVVCLLLWLISEQIDQKEYYLRLLPQNPYLCLNLRLNRKVYLLRRQLLLYQEDPVRPQDFEKWSCNPGLTNLDKKCALEVRHCCASHATIAVMTDCAGTVRTNLFIRIVANVSV